MPWKGKETNKRTLNKNPGQIGRGFFIGNARTQSTSKASLTGCALLNKKFFFYQNSF